MGLLEDLDDLFHTEGGVLAAVLGVHEARYHPVSGLLGDYPLERLAVRERADPAVLAGGQAAALSLPAFALSAPAAPQGRPLVRVPRVRAPYRGGGSRQTLGGLPAVAACGNV